MTKYFIKIRFLIIILLFITILLSSGIYAIKFFSPKKAALFIQSNPETTVYIDDIEMGQTPFEIELESGEISLKLIPVASSKLISYESKIKLAHNVKTIVRRNIGETRETSSGEIISFEKTKGKEANLSIISNPDVAQVFIDGVFGDFTPAKFTNIAIGEHELKVAATTYVERVFTVSPEIGYNLTAIVELARDPIAIKEREESVLAVTAESNVPKVKILDTPTGFLRVRELDTLGGKEIDTVAPGEEFELIETNDDETWYKIKISSEITGWISSKYAVKLDEDVEEE